MELEDIGYYLHMTKEENLAKLRTAAKRIVDHLPVEGLMETIIINERLVVPYLNQADIDVDTMDEDEWEYLRRLITNGVLTKRNSTFVSMPRT